ncbi:MAG: putative signal transducing protein [Gemmatimonadota bacterium]
MSRKSAWTVIATYAAVYQAEMAASVLDDAGIPVRLSGEQAGVFGAGYSGTVTGGVALLVPADAAEAARELLEDGELPGEG